jgi:hypothetical protein
MANVVSWRISRIKFDQTIATFTPTANITDSLQLGCRKFRQKNNAQISAGETIFSPKQISRNKTTGQSQHTNQPNQRDHSPISTCQLDQVPEPNAKVHPQVCFLSLF